MSLSISWPRNKGKQIYKSVDTESTDDEHDQDGDHPIPTDHNGRNSIDSETLLKRYTDEEQLEYRNVKDHLSWSLRRIAFVCGNIILFLISVSLFFRRG
jgi:hypothetical protein